MFNKKPIAQDTAQAIGKALCTNAQLWLDLQAKTDNWHKRPGQSVPFFNCPPHLHRNYSMVGSMGARRWPNYPFVAVVAGDPSKISLRSHPEGADVSEIARPLGGGGHRNAAGFSL